MMHALIRQNTAKQIVEKLSATLLLAFLLLIASVLLSHKAMAFNTGAPEIGDNAPQDSSADIIGGTNNPVQPWMSVGVGSYNGPTSYAKIYVPVGKGATLTIHNGGGYCEINNVFESLDVKSKGYGNPDVDYSIYNLSDQELWSTGTPPPSGYNTPSTAAGTKVNSLSGGTGCQDLTLKFPGGIASVHPGHEQYKVYYFEADMTNGSPGCTPGVCDTEKNFRLSINNGGRIGWSRHMVDHPVNQFGIYMRDAPYRGGNNWNYAVQFAPYCDEKNVGPTASVVVKDIDWNVQGYPQPNLTGLVDQDNRTDSNFNWGLAPPGEPSSKKVANDWPSGNGTTARLTFDISNVNHRYLLEFRDIYYRNTIQIELPFDQFDAQQSVGNACNAQQFSCNQIPISPADGSKIQVNQDTTVTVTGSPNSATWVAPGANGGYYIERIGATDIGSTGGNEPVPTNLTIGSTANPYFDKVHPPPGTTQATYTYQVVNNSLPTGTNAYCSVTYNVGSPPTSAAPYFQVWQNDAASGGAFMKADDSCPGAYSAYVSPYTASQAGKGANSLYYGGIRANSKDFKSGTDFGAVALGLIPNTNDEGFGSPNSTLFANNLTGLGITGGTSGYFNHTDARQAHCVTDFYDKTRIGTPTVLPVSTITGDITDNSCQIDINTNSTHCQRQVNGDLVIDGPINIPARTQVTLYVAGNVTINGDIKYPSSYNPNDINSIPYIAIIALGNITLTNNTTQLDGLYVAQPTLSGNTASGGIFKTCDSQCPSQLIVNGAVIAQRIELLRAHGSSQAADASTTGNTPAEIFNFVPSMVLGAPAFSPQPSTPGNLISLPPVF